MWKASSSSKTMSEKRAANASAVGGKTARPCDGCLKKRARWYCAADDAFLCQSCDASVHSANSLAQRHERLRLKTASSLKQPYESCANNAQPAWHGGFQRKTRTSRPHPHPKLPKPEPPSLSNLLLVPELGDETLEENEEQLLYRVPIFDPMLSEFCSTPLVEGSSPVGSAADEVKPASMPEYAEPAGNVDNLPRFIPSDVDLAEFAADVESLLGRGLEEDTFCMEGLGLLDSQEAELEWRGGDGGGGGGGGNGGGGGGGRGGRSRVKLEKEVVEDEVETEMDTLELNFDCNTSTTGEDEEQKVHRSYVDEQVGSEKVFLLRLDYEAVMMAWAGQGLPSTIGDGLSGPDLISYGDMGVGRHMVVSGEGDGGREARVSRYREKRRTRLFHKKIRYEVRKLNAEKRPRMKGRFVKRASFASPAFPF